MRQHRWHPVRYPPLHECTLVPFTVLKRFVPYRYFDQLFIMSVQVSTPSVSVNLPVASSECEVDAPRLENVDVITILFASTHGTSRAFADRLARSLQESDVATLEPAPSIRVRGRIWKPAPSFQALSEPGLQISIKKSCCSLDKLAGFLPQSFGGMTLIMTGQRWVSVFQMK